MIKLDFYCDSNKFYFYITNKLYSISYSSNNIEKRTTITYDKYCQEYGRCCFTSKSIYIENDEYCLIYLFDKLTNEEFLEIFITWRLHSLVNLFGNLYLGIWEND